MINCAINVLGQRTKDRESRANIIRNRRMGSLGEFQSSQRVISPVNHYKDQGFKIKVLERLSGSGSNSGGNRHDDVSGQDSSQTDGLLG